MWAYIYCRSPFMLGVKGERGSIKRNVGGQSNQKHKTLLVRKPMSAAREAKRRRTCFAPGDILHAPVDAPAEDADVVVIADNGREIIVAQRGGYTKRLPACRFGESGGYCKSTWRQKLKPGDDVMFLVGCVWHPARVRGLMRGCGPGGGSSAMHLIREHSLQGVVVVLEPAFLGNTISLPLRSFSLREIHGGDITARALIDSGFAFDDAHLCPHSWPEYSPDGVFKTRVDPPVYSYRDDAAGAFAPQNCWVASPPCSLPEQLRYVHMIQRDGMVPRSHKTVIERASNIRSAPRSRAKRVKTVHLGSIHVKLEVPVTPSGFEVHQVMVATMFCEMGDFVEAAKCLTPQMLGGRQFWSSEDAEIALALQHYATKGWVESRSEKIPLWGSYSDFVYDLVDAKPETIRSSLLWAVGDIIDDCPDVQRLADRVNIWNQYERVWRNARWMQVHTESVHPIEVRLYDISDGFARFSVSVNFAEDHANMGFAQSRTWQKYGSTILSAFSDLPEASSLGTLDPLRWDEEVLRACGRDSADDVVSAVQARSADVFSVSMRHCLDRELKTADGGRLFWNVCEGVFARPSYTNGHYRTVNGDLKRTVEGGVLVHPRDADRFRTVVRILRDPPVIFEKPTLLLTRPTLLYEWQRHFSLAGIDAHVYHGQGRRGPAANEIMRRGGVVIASFRVVCTWDDMFYFNRSGVGHLIVDEFDTTSPSSVFLGGLMRLKTHRVWMLSKRATRDVLAIALPVLRVRPFSSLSAWDTDASGDYRRRPHVHALLFDELESLNSECKQALYSLISKVFIVYNDASSPGRFLHVRHPARGDFSLQHRLLFKSMVEMMMHKRKALGRRHPWNDSEAQMSTTWQHFVKAAYGIKPQVHLCGEGTTFQYPDFRVDASSHATVMKVRAERGGRVASKSIIEAADMVSRVAVGFPPEGDCPICFKPLRDCVDAVVGVCGHAVCGQCCATMRTAVDNFRGSGHPHEEDDLRNRLTCPICRDSWAAGRMSHERRPLYMCCQPDKQASIDQRPRRGYATNRIYLTPRALGNNDFAENNVMLHALCSVLETLRKASPPGKIVVVTQSSEMCDHLYRVGERMDTPDHLALKVSSCVSVAQRGNHLSSFQLRESNFDLLFTTASLVQGIAFEHVRHWVFCENSFLDSEVEILKSAMRSSANRGWRPVLHTISPPECRRLLHIVPNKKRWIDRIFFHEWWYTDLWKKTSAAAARATSTTGDGKALAEQVCVKEFTFPSNLVNILKKPETVEDYIRAFCRFFGVGSPLSTPTELEAHVAGEFASKLTDPPSIDLTGEEQADGQADGQGNRQGNGQAAAVGFTVDQPGDVALVQTAEPVVLHPSEVNLEWLPPAFVSGSVSGSIRV